MGHVTPEDAAHCKQSNQEKVDQHHWSIFLSVCSKTCVILSPFEHIRPSRAEMRFRTKAQYPYMKCRQKGATSRSRRFSATSCSWQTVAGYKHFRNRKQGVRVKKFKASSRPHHPAAAGLARPRRPAAAALPAADPHQTPGGPCASCRTGSEKRSGARRSWP